MIKKLLLLALLLSTWSLQAQVPIYDFVDFRKTLNVPKGLTSERTAVLFSVPTVTETFKVSGDAETMINQAHRAFATMGIDPILYLDQHDYTASKRSMSAYRDLFAKRHVKVILFLTQNEDNYEVLIGRLGESVFLLDNKEDVFYLMKNELYPLLLSVGKEIRRADMPATNFLIPEKPTYLNGISIVEKSLLKNYPSVLRRSKLAVERFASLPIPQSADSSSIQKIRAYNADIEQKNLELDRIMKGYPFDYEVIDPMSDENLIRNRYQYVLRSLSGKANSVRRMLEYEVLPTETGFVSLVPTSNGEAKTKMIPKNALVHKFYIKQNISKNVHVGEWDADGNWQSALKNLIGNLSNDLNF